MQNITKKFIIIFGAIVFSLVLTNSAQATYVTHYAYSTDPVGYQYDGYDNNLVPTYPSAQPIYQKYVYNSVTPAGTDRPNIVNNYYYQTAPATTAKTNTTSTSKTTSDTSVNSESVNSGSNNGLGASAYDNGITALSLHGSGGFMPSSIWQWMLVIVLILIIIIISRILMRKPSIEEQEAHIAHAH